MSARSGSGRPVMKNTATFCLRAQLYSERTWRIAGRSVCTAHDVAPSKSSAFAQA